MKRQLAFVEKRPMLKGNLHCHTTRSDGRLTPEENLQMYKEHGYDFLAITDHRRYNFENFAPETGITVIPGMEMDNGRSIPCKSGFRCYHTVCIGPTKEKGNGYSQDEVLQSSTAASAEEYQKDLDAIHQKGNLTIHCHPEWSGTSAKYFESLKGNFAMEIWNSGCVLGYDMDKDAAYWDELLGQGKKIFGVATDDGHCRGDNCHGWVRVNAENTVEDILDALAKGAFYASSGPEIYDFYVEGETAVVECSPALRVRFHADAHPTRIVRSGDGSLTRAELDMAGNYGQYIRASVVDKEGRIAWTNPIFFDEE